MLAATLGPNKATVKVNADLNVDETTEKELTYAAKGTPLKQTQETEELEGGAAGRGRHGGHRRATSRRTPRARPRGGTNSNYNRKKTDTDYGVNKTITETKIAKGAVNKLNVALMVDKSVPADVFDSLEQTVSAAAGIDQARGDTFQAAQMAFAKAETPKAGPVPTTLLGPLKWVGLGLASLLFLFFMVRGMKKRENDNLGTPAWLAEIEEPISLAQLEARTSGGYALDERHQRDAAPACAGRQPASARSADGARARARRCPGQGLDGRGLVGCRRNLPPSPRAARRPRPA